MAFYAEEEEVWKCPKHPSRRRRSGICPNCLRERLVSLCPHCANVRPCACCVPAATPAPSYPPPPPSSVGRVSNLIDSEPAFRRSRSMAVPLFRSKLRGIENTDPPAVRRGGKVTFWSSVFKSQKTKAAEEAKRNEALEGDTSVRMKMMRSSSVGVSSMPASTAGDVRSSRRGWSFPSPITVFRQSKTSRVVQER